jgi:hypothetical protein
VLSPGRTGGALGGQLSFQASQGPGDLTAHPGSEQPEQYPQSALHLNSLHHPDTSPGQRLEHVVEDDLAHRHRAFGHPAPPVIYRRDSRARGKTSRMCCSASPTYLFSSSGPLMLRKKLFPSGCLPSAAAAAVCAAPCLVSEFATALAISVLP